MATSIGHLAVLVSANTAGFAAGMASAQRGVTSFISGLGGMAAKLTGIGSVMAASVGAFKGFTDNQEAEITFGSLLGNADRAKTLINELEVAGRKTTFADAFMDSAKELAKFNVGSEDIIPTLGKLSNIAAAVDVPLVDLARTFGEVKYKGQLTEKQLVSLTEKGIPLVQELMRATGASESAVLEMVSEGRVGFNEFAKAIEAATGEGGRFFGMAEARGQTTMGGLTRTGQNLVGVLEEFGETLGAALGQVFGFQGGLAGVADWLGEVANGMGSIQPFIEEFLTGLKRIWFEASFVFNNFGELVRLGVLKAGLFIVEFVNDATHFFTVQLPEVVRWFARNWVEVLTDAFRFIGTIFANFGDNVIRLFQNLPGLITGATSWDEVWKPLTDGFVPTIKEQLKLSEREMTEFERNLRRGIDQLQGELGAKREAFIGEKMAQVAAVTKGGFSLVPGANLKPGQGPGAMAVAAKSLNKDAGKQFAGAFEVGSKEAYNLLLGSRNFDKAPAERTAKASEDINKKQGEAVKELKAINKAVSDFTGVEVASLDGDFGGGGF